MGMARALRVRRPGGRYPVAVRGYDRKAIFRRQSAPALPSPNARFNASPGQPPRNCRWPPSATIGRTGRRCPPGRLRPRPLPSNPNGILSHSPRLAHQRLPWVIIPQPSSTPTWLRPCVMLLPGLASTTSRCPKRPPNFQPMWRLNPALEARHHCRTPNPIKIFSPVGPASSGKHASRIWVLAAASRRRCFARSMQSATSSNTVVSTTCSRA